MKHLVLGSLSMLSVATAAAIERPAEQALELCHRAEMAGAEERMTMLVQGLARAEQAIAETPDDPRAHFALFCNLAKRIAAEGMGLRRIGDLLRARRALDRSIELDPSSPDALAAKGAFLYYAPRFAGGDIEEGERMIRRSLKMDPQSPARLVLVELLTYKRELDEAREQARVAVVAIRSSEKLRVRAGAHALLVRLCDREERPIEIVEALEPVC